MGKQAKIRTETVTASELYERVILPVARLQDPAFVEAEKEFPKKLAAYEKERGDRPEAEGADGIFKAAGFYEIGPDGKPVFTPRPRKPGKMAYYYTPYDRTAGFVDHATQRGILPGSLHNRDIRNERVETYAAIMGAGEWRDLLSDPIAITAAGEVLNGQHRLSAAYLVERGPEWSGDGWDQVSNDPLFMVIWGVDPAEALYADGSKRTAKDQATIGQKLASTNAN